MEVFHDLKNDKWSIRKSDDDYDVVIKCSNPNRDEDEFIEEYLCFKACYWRYGDLRFTHHEWCEEQRLIDFNEEETLKKIYTVTKNN
jgi:hypothetical protein